MVLLVQEVNPSFAGNTPVDVYGIAFGDNTQIVAMRMAEQLRDALPQLRIMNNYGGGNMKKQFSRADKWGAKVAFVIGESEVQGQQVVIKDLRTGHQETVLQSEAANYLANLLN